MPAFTQYVGGGGPIIPGPLFPFVFITIACGAISGFHALIASGTTPKMVDKESRHPADRLRRDAVRRAGRRHGARSPRRRCTRATTTPSTRRPPSSRRSDAPARRCRPSTSPTSKAQVGENVVGRTGGARVAGGRHGRHLQPAARHARPDGVLVSLRDHVRGAVHPDDDRRGHARRPLRCCRSSSAASGSRSRAPTGCPARSISTALIVPGVGLLHLDRQHRHDLADVRRRQPAARRRRACGRHDDPDQHGHARSTRGSPSCRSASSRRRR